MNAAARPTAISSPILAPGFEAELMVDMPHATRAKKLYLVVESPDRWAEPEPTIERDRATQPDERGRAGITRPSRLADPD